MDFINHQKRYYQWWKLVFDITDLSNFSNVKDIILPIHVFPTLDQDQQKLRPGPTKIIWYNSNYWLSKNQKLDRRLCKNLYFCGSPKKLSCEIYESIVITNSFKLATAQRSHFIRLEMLKCSFKNEVFFFKCKTCLKQCTGSTENVRPRLNSWWCI